MKKLVGLVIGIGSLVIVFAGLNPLDRAMAADEFTYDVGAGVTAADVDLIKTGFEIGQAFLEAHLGGDIAEAIRKQITVKIVATGQGNQELGGGGACCTSSSPTGAIRPFFDVAHPHWTSSRPSFWPLTSDHYKTVVHEYAHGWQLSLGCLQNQPLGSWLNEGIAEYVGTEALILRGDMRRVDVLNHQLGAALDTMRRPLSSFGGPSSDLWPGHIGYVALERLVPRAPLGLASLRVICEQVTAGASVSAAFAGAFGIELDVFYADFEAWRIATLAAPAILLVLNDANATPGSNLRLEFVEANFGPATLADFYLGVLLPAEAGPGFGCPNRDAVAFFSGTGAVVTCLSASAATFARYHDRRALPSGFVASTVDAVHAVWPPGIPPGPYTFFAALTHPGSLDVISVSVQVVSFHP